MDYKKLFVVLVLVIIITTSAVVFYLNRESVLKNTMPTGQKQQIQVEDRKIAEDQKPLKIDIAYPYIEGQNNFNDKIKNYLNQQIKDFKTNSLENDAAIKKVDPESYAKYPRTYDMVAEYAVGEVDENVISIVFEIYMFEGGAHGNTTFYGFNYSSKDKKEIQLTDLFPNQPDYLDKISKYCFTDLTKQITERMGATDGSWIDQGTQPKLENFSVFLVNKDSIVFYFPQYQVAPYAAGDFKVIYPR